MLFIFNMVITIKKLLMMYLLFLYTKGKIQFNATKRKVK